MSTTNSAGIEAATEARELINDDGHPGNVRHALPLLVVVGSGTAAYRAVGQVGAGDSD